MTFHLVTFHLALFQPLEVKLAHQELELVNQLKRMLLGQREFKVIREKAEQLRSGTLRSRGQALLPLMLAAFVFDALVITTACECRPSRLPEDLSLPSTAGSCCPCAISDEGVGFEAAIAALAMKANVSEADHPLLCEGTRKQVGWEGQQFNRSKYLCTFVQDELLKIYKKCGC